MSDFGLFEAWATFLYWLFLSHHYVLLSIFLGIIASWFAFIAFQYWLDDYGRRCEERRRRNLQEELRRWRETPFTPPTPEQVEAAAKHAMQAAQARH